MKTGVGGLIRRESVCRELRGRTDATITRYVYSLITNNSIGGVYCEIRARKEVWDDGLMVAETSTTVGGQGRFADAVRNVFRIIEGGNATVDPIHLPDVVRDSWIGDHRDT